MNIGADPEHDLTRIGFLRFLADLGASLNVIFDRLMEGFAQPFHGIGMKARPAISQARNPALKLSSTIVRFLVECRMCWTCLSTWRNSASSSTFAGCLFILIPIVEKRALCAFLQI